MKIKVEKLLVADMEPRSTWSRDRERFILMLRFSSGTNSVVSAFHRAVVDSDDGDADKEGWHCEIFSKMEPLSGSEAWVDADVRGGGRSKSVSSSASVVAKWAIGNDRNFDGREIFFSRTHAERHAAEFSFDVPDDSDECVSWMEGLSKPDASLWKAYLPASCSAEIDRLLLKESSFGQTERNVPARSSM